MVISSRQFALDGYPPRTRELLHGWDDATEGDHLLVPEAPELFGGSCGMTFTDGLVCAQGMAGDVETKDLPLGGEALGVRPFRHVGELWRLCPPRPALQHLQERDLPLRPIPEESRGGLHGLIDGRHQLRPAIAERVKGPTLDQAVDHPLVEQPEIHPLAEVM